MLSSHEISRVLLMNYPFREQDSRNTGGQFISKTALRRGVGCSKYLTMRWTLTEFDTSGCAAIYYLSSYPSSKAVPNKEYGSVCCVAWPVVR